MRRIILSVNLTLDGFVSGPDGELDWHFPHWDSEMSDYASEHLDKTDTLLLGRITYQAMASYWPFQLNNPLFPRTDIPYADMMNNHAKIVFSKTLAAAKWNNTTVLQKISAHEINQLKQQHGKCMLIYGSRSIAQAFINLKLVDEFMFWVHPVLIGRGVPLLTGLNRSLEMRLSKNTKFHSGVLVSHYSVA